MRACQLHFSRFNLLLPTMCDVIMWAIEFGNLMCWRLVWLHVFVGFYTTQCVKFVMHIKFSSSSWSVDLSSDCRGLALSFLIIIIIDLSSMAFSNSTLYKISNKPVDVRLERGMEMLSVTNRINDVITCRFWFVQRWLCLRLNLHPDSAVLCSIQCAFILPFVDVEE